jgi:hypothetical protein
MELVGNQKIMKIVKLRMNHADLKGNNKVKNGEW